MADDKHRATPRVLPQASLLPPGKASSTLTVLSSSQGRNLSGAHKATPEFTRHPGYSLHEWKRVCETGGDLAGVGGKLLKVTPEELARHQLESDVWTSVRGKVYNITPFLKYHPGGKAQLLRGAGIDCTELYDKLHTWVNEQAVLKKCFVGVLVPSAAGTVLQQAGGVVREEKKGSEEEQVISMVVPELSTLCLDGKYETSV